MLPLGSSLLQLVASSFSTLVYPDLTGAAKHDTVTTPGVQYILKDLGSLFYSTLG